MLDLLQNLAALFEVFAFSVLGVTSGTVGYVLFQCCLRGATGQREARSGSGDADTRYKNQKRNTSIYWSVFRANPSVSTGFTRDEK